MILVGVAAAYFAVAKLGLSFAADHDVVSAVWPPSGLALAAVVLLGRRVWPAIAAGALVANVTGDSSLATAAGIATGNTVAALVAGSLLARAGFDPSLRRVRDVVALAILGAAASTAINASIGVATLWASGIVDPGGLWAFWRVWWLGDLTGVLLVAPPILIAVRGLRDPPRLRQIAEASGLALALVAVTLFVLSQAVTLAYPVFPLIVLAAMRFRQPGAVLAALVVSALAVLFTGSGQGPFVGGSADDELLRAQVFVGLAAMTGLLVAAMRTEWERAEIALEKLADSEAILADAQRVARIGSWEWEMDVDRVSWSNELYRIFGVAPADFGASYGAYLELVHPDDRDHVEAAIGDTLEREDDFAVEHRAIRPDGEIRILECHGRVITDQGGRPLRMVGTAQDVTESRAAQDRFRDLVESAPDAMVILDEDGTIVRVNSRTESMFGFGRDELIGEPVGLLLPDPESQTGPVNPTLFPNHESGPSLAGGDRMALRRDGSKVPVDVSFSPLRTAGSLLVVGAIRDVTERKLAQERLEHQALHDPLTGLPNRTLFLDRLEHALARSRRPGSNLAVYFCDVDNFKRVNDGLGHEAGDELLRALPARIGGALRQADTVARFGGDELVILCEDLGTEADAMVLAERITGAFRQPFVLDETEHHLSVSVGIVFVRGGHATASEVLRDADVAMYRAKARGRGRFELFDARMRARALERLETEKDLRRALDDDQLRLVYQPVSDLGRGRLVAAEALLRWDDPLRGERSPSEFIDIAEDSGLIVPIGAWVIAEACRNAAAWSLARGPDHRLAVSINLSPRQVSDVNLVGLVDTAIDETGVDPKLIELEITENALIDDAEAARATLRQLKEKGIRLVLDDFGTGHSSLSRLKSFPIDSLKIDREFISGLGRDSEDTAIVAAVLSMAGALDLDVVAEGVETPEQLDWLTRHGCRLAQGFLLSAPLSAEELERSDPAAAEALSPQC